MGPGLVDSNSAHYEHGDPDYEAGHTEQAHYSQYVHVEPINLLLGSLRRTPASTPA